MMLHSQCPCTQTWKHSKLDTSVSSRPEVNPVHFGQVSVHKHAWIHFWRTKTSEVSLQPKWNPSVTLRCFCNATVLQSQSVCIGFSIGVARKQRTVWYRLNKLIKRLSPAMSLSTSLSALRQAQGPQINSLNDVGHHSQDESKLCPYNELLSERYLRQREYTPDLPSLEPVRSISQTLKNHQAI